MFHLQPGTGLGFPASREMALGLGGVSVVFIITPGGGLDEEGFVLKKRRSRTEDELALLIFMVSAIEQDRDN